MTTARVQQYTWYYLYSNIYILYASHYGAVYGRNYYKMTSAVIYTASTDVRMYWRNNNLIHVVVVRIGRRWALQ